MPEEIVAEMADNDIEEERNESLLCRQGFKVVGSIENPRTTPEAVAQAKKKP